MCLFAVFLSFASADVFQVAQVKTGASFSIFESYIIRSENKSVQEMEAFLSRNKPGDLLNFLEKHSRDTLKTCSALKISEEKCNQENNLQNVMDIKDIKNLISLQTE